MSRGNPLLKKLDRWIGIPAVALASVGRRRGRPERIRRIGLLKTAAIGDTLLMGGLADDLRAAFPGATIIAITGPDNAAAAGLIGPFDEQLTINPKSPLSAVASVRASRLDVLIDFGSWPRFDALLAALSGARHTIGFRTPGQYRHFAYDALVDHSDEIHERENYARLLGALGVAVRGLPRINLGKDSEREIPIPSPYVVFHPWAGGYMHEVKEWATESWVELARRLSPAVAVAISGSAADAARSAALAAAMRGAGIPAHDASGKFSLPQLGHVFAKSAGVVSVNTGVMHLASLAGAPTVSLEGPTPVHRWRPLGPRVRCVESRLTGCGYLHLGFEYAGQRLDCMRGIGVDAVYEALTELMSAS